MEGPATGMYPPPGWANTVTPSFATTNCGFINQTENYSTDGDAPLSIPFNGSSSWTTTNWVPNDASGSVWGCTQGGIYGLAAGQTLTLFNAADATNPIVNVSLVLESLTTSECNQAFTTSIAVPITTAPIDMSVTVSGLANIDQNTTMTIYVQSVSGNVTCTSKSANLGESTAYISWNLIALGSYGNLGLVIG